MEARLDMTAFHALVERRHVLVCCGTGGVGKTTISAVLAIEGARRGRRVVVMTIDPAKRLADTLGVADVGSRPHVIDPMRWAGSSPRAPLGSLSAFMLDTATTFDGLVARYAHSDEQRERILGNRFYRNIASALSGTQEYMAMEKLYEMHASGAYDLIVVDTPPTRHALDFLDAPQRLTRLLDNRIFRLLMLPTRASMRFAGAAVHAFVHTTARVVGAEVIDDVVAFFRAFEGMEQGFRERAAATRELLADPSTSFVLVTSPSPDAVDEAVFFANRLRQGSLAVSALVVNRVHPEFAPAHRIPDLRARAVALATPGHEVGGTAAEARRHLAECYRILADYSQLAARERAAAAEVADRLGHPPVAFVPYLAREVSDFDALSEVSMHLFATEAPSR